MKKTNKFVAALSIAALSTLISSVAFAAEGDIYDVNKYDTVKYSSDKIALEFKVQQEITLNDDMYGYEHNGKIYKYDEVNELYTKNQSNIDATLKALDSGALKQLATVKGEEEGLKVESVSAINKQGVTVKITALTEALSDVTVEVKDDKGNVVEVKPVSVLDVGETTATFAFKTALTTEAAGTWTVNGVAFDANAQAAVKAVKEAANQVELLTALNSSYFTGVNSDLIAEYFADADRGNVATVKDVQDIINKINKAAATQGNVKAVQDAKNQVQLLAALQSFERVNADLIAQYAAGSSSSAGIEFKTAPTPNVIYTNDSNTTGTNAAAVQAAIDAVNLKVAIDAVTAADTTTATALKAESIAKAQSLVNALPAETVQEKTDKKSLQDKIDVANAFAKVKGATTQASLLSALKTPVLKLQNIDDTLAKFYKVEFDKPTGKDAITSVAYNLQTLIVNTGKTGAITDLGDKISKVTAETSTSDIKALLVELKRLDGTVFIADINDALLEDYRANLVKTSLATNKDETSEIQGIIDTVNNPATALTVLVDSSSELINSDKLLAALKAKTLNLTVVEANKDAYFADITLIKTAAATDAKTVQKAVNAINAVVEANAATTAEAMRTALTNHAANLATPNAAYLNLTAQAKLEVAEIVLEAKTADFANSSEVTTTVGATAGAGALKVHADILTAVNGEKADSSITAIDAALQKVGYKAYNDLGVVERLAVAQSFLENLPVDDTGAAVTLTYKSLAAIKADIDTAIAK